MRHISTSIEGLKALTNYHLKKLAPYIIVDGIALRTASQVRKMLAEAQAQGLECLPARECDNYDERGYCKGHERN